MIGSLDSVLYKAIRTVYIFEAAFSLTIETGSAQSLNEMGAMMSKTVWGEKIVAKISIWPAINSLILHFFASFCYAIHKEKKYYILLVIRKNSQPLFHVSAC